MTDTTPSAASVYAAAQTVIAYASATVDQQAAWGTGAVDGGFHVDGTPTTGAGDPLAGYYPFNLPGNAGILYVPCPAKAGALGAAGAIADVVGGAPADRATFGAIAPLISYASRASAAAAFVPAGVQSISCLGIAVQGDCSAHHCARISDPGGALPVWQFRTNGGALCWEVRERFMSTDLFGVVADAVTITSIQTLVAGFTTNQVNAPGANFLSTAKVGQMFAISGAGLGGANFYSVIASIQSNNICTLRDVPSTAVTNASGGWGTDNTAAMQAAATWATRGDVAGVNTGLQTELVHTAGLIGISGAISLTSAFAVTGFHWTVFGGRGSQSGSGIVQFADNAPIWEVGNIPAWGNKWEGGIATYATDPSQSLTNRCYINPTATVNGNDFHDNAIVGLTPTNMHYVVISPNALFWGNYCHDWFASKITGGFLNIQSAVGGQPNNVCSKLYLLAQVTAGPIFLCQAQQIEFISVEINQSPLGPAFLADAGAGDYVFSRVRSEVSTYGQPSVYGISAFIIAPNSKVVGDRVEVATVTVPAGQSFYLFHQIVNPGVATCRVRYPSISLASSTGGKAFYSNCLTECVMENVPLSTNVFISNNGEGVSAAADYTKVTALTDATSQRFNVGSASSSSSLQLLSTDNPSQIWRSPLAYDVTVKLPNIYDDNLFSGRPYKLHKADKTGPGRLIVTDYNSNVLATIPAASAGVVELFYNRTRANGPAQGWYVAPLVLG